jgi:hypothetical protein
MQADWLQAALPWPLPATKQAVSIPHFCYHQTMTIGITGPERKAPGRSAVVGFIIAVIIAGICLFLFGLASDFLVDWLWFSSIGYLQVFLISIGAKAAVFFAVLTATAVILSLPRGAPRAMRRRPICSRSCVID